MRTILRLGILVAAIIGFLARGTACDAGDLADLFGHRSDCGCGHSAGFPGVQSANFVYMAPAIENGCACLGVAAGCCGVGGGMMQMGNLYGAESFYGIQSGPSGSSLVPGSFLSGYEGLPNMDGGGIHHRYPYHSYRRPWAHPGTPSTNVTIVW